MDRQSLFNRLNAEAPALRRKYGVKSLAVFGSALRDDFHEGSDLDLLVEFEPGQVPGLSFFAMQDELTALLGCTVDLNTAGWLSPCFRDEVRHAAKVIYDAG